MLRGLNVFLNFSISKKPFFLSEVVTFKNVVQSDSEPASGAGGDASSNLVIPTSIYKERPFRGRSFFLLSGPYFCSDPFLGHP
jgi:hypothetical protein